MSTTTTITQPNQSLVEYMKAQGAVSMQKVDGPNGAFISGAKEDGTKITLPVGGNSQAGTLTEFRIFITDDGAAIATVNAYKATETMSLV